MSEWQPAILLGAHRILSEYAYLIGRKIHIRPFKPDHRLRAAYIGLGCCSEARFFESEEKFEVDGRLYSLVLCEHEILTD